MSLIRQNQREKSEVDQPRAENIKTVQPPVAPEVAGDFSSFDEEPMETGQFPDAVGLTEDEPPQQPAASMVHNPADLINLQPNELSLPGLGVTAPTDESTIGLAGVKTSIWQDIATDYGVDKLNAPEILNAKIPTVYQTLPGQDSYRAHQLGNAAINATDARYRQEAENEAARQQERLAQLGRTPNTPQEDRRGSTFGKLFNDLLFGSKKAQEEAHSGRFNPLRLQYGQQGAGVGGWLKYVLGMTENLPIAVNVEGAKLVSSALTRLGVPEAEARKFTEAGVLGYLPDVINPRTYFGFDWEKAWRTNQVLDALVGAPTGDTNDQEGNNKGVLFSRQRRDGEMTGNVFVDYSRIAAQDPVGTAREVILNVFNPIDNPIGDAVGAGIRFLIPKRATRTLGNAASQTVEAKVEAAQAAARALPPGKAAPGIPVETQLREAFGQQAAEAGRRAMQPQRAIGAAPDLPRLPPVAEGSVEFAADVPLNVRPQAEGDILGRIVPDPPQPVQLKPRLEDDILRQQPFSADAPISVKGTPEADILNRIPGEVDAPANIRMSVEQQVLESLRSAPDPFDVDAPVNLRMPQQSVEIEVPPPITLKPRLKDDLIRNLPATQPTKAPRILEGTNSVTQRALPPAIDIEAVKVPGSERIILDTPDGAALQIGIGKPSDVPIEIAEDGFAIRVGNRDIKVTPHPLARGKMEVLDIDELAAKVDNFVQPDGTNAIGNRLADVDDFLKNSDEVFAPEIYIRKDGKVIIGDGRHRLAVMRQQGIKQVPVMVFTEADELAEAAADVADEFVPDSVMESVAKAADDLMAKARELAAADSRRMDDLLARAREFAAQKAVIEAPLKQLDEIFDTVVDFGRRTVDDIPYQGMTPETVMDAFISGNRVDIPPAGLRQLNKMYPGVGDILKNNDTRALGDYVSRHWIDPQRFAVDVSDAANDALKVRPNPDAMAKVVDPRQTVLVPSEVYHGTALSNWSPDYNVSLYGTRGELGTGLYMTTKPLQAEKYAKAMTSENISAAVADRSIQPGVYKLRHSLTNVLDARRAIPSGSPEVSAILEGLPDELVRAVKKSVQRDKTTTYNSILTKVEANLVRAKMEPTEETLKNTFDTISDNLRRLGFDGVYDEKSGFMMALDTTKISKDGFKSVSPPRTPLQAAVNRYNNDAYAAKFYQERLTTDANLRDSAYKVLSQLDANVDKKLKAVQTEIINRGLDARESVLPPRQAYEGALAGKPKPQTFQEAIADIKPESLNPCD